MCAQCTQTFDNIVYIYIRSKRYNKTCRKYIETRKIKTKNSYLRSDDHHHIHRIVIIQTIIKRRTDIHTQPHHAKCLFKFVFQSQNLITRAVCSMNDK